METERRRCRRRRRPARRHGLPVRRGARDRHLPRAADAAAAAARGRARHRQDRAGRGDRRRRSTCRWSGCSATRGSTRPRRSTTGTSRARSCTCGRSRRPAPGADVEEAEKSLYDERFLLARPVLAALQQSPAVLLVDEVDRADDEFEAFLLEVLSTYQVSIPELGTVAAATPPVVVLTSNRTRELHDALKRRCLYHWIEHPGLEREVQIVRSRAPEVSEELARQVVGVVQQLRGTSGSRSRPGSPRPSTGRGPCTTSAPPRWTSSRRPAPSARWSSTARTPSACSRRSTGCCAHDRRRDVREPDEILLGFARALRAAGVPVTHDRAAGFLAAVAVVGPRRRRGDVRRRPGHALRVTRRPGPLRPGVRRVLQRAATGCPGRGRPRRASRRSPGCPWPRATERPASPTTRWCARWPATPRCCGTATWPRCPRRRRRGWRRCSRPCGRAPRGGVPPDTSGGTAAPSTRRARCAPACGTWASPRRSPGGGAGTSRAASSFWWTCPVR